MQADSSRITRAQAEALVAGLHFQRGDINLQNGLATLHVPEGFRFLDGPDAHTVLVDLWGNPPRANPLGMLMPATVNPLGADRWGIIILYEDIGYISDADAARINYANLLAEMQKDLETANEAREKAGYRPMHLVGWAKAPTYDASTHKLAWAKEINNGEGTPNTLNYNIRVLGRGGVLVLSVVAPMARLHQIEQSIPKILASVEFNPGFRYDDFKIGPDKVAPFGLAGLVAGGNTPKSDSSDLHRRLVIALIILVGIAVVAVWSRKRSKNKGRIA